MSLQSIVINSVQITFDKDKTKEYRTNYNNPCECQNCRNYYKNIENNGALLEFLSDFGIDYKYTEEVFSWDLGNNSDSLIHHEGYYGVFGRIEGDGFSTEKFGTKIIFAKSANIPHDRQGDYFWICIDADFPYLLDEKRDLPISFYQKIREGSIIKRIKNLFKRN